MTARLAKPPLQEFNFWEIRVISLPESVIRLPSLEELVIQARPEFGHVPSEVLSQQGGDNCLFRLPVHLADLNAVTVPLRKLKVIVLGNGRIGKTQFWRRLRGRSFEPDAGSTHGLSVTTVELEIPGDRCPRARYSPP